eukprot:IDg5777t1
MPNDRARALSEISDNFDALCATQCKQALSSSEKS